MSELNSKFSREDIETLIESVSDWETIGNHDYHVLQTVKSMPMPPEEHEAYESMTQIKEYFRNRERDIMASRAVRQEKSTFIRAKLMMVRREMGISELFEMATQNTPVAASNSQREYGDNASVQAEQKLPENPEQVKRSKLELAEAFIRDLGVWAHYEKFLSENS